MGLINIPFIFIFYYVVFPSYWLGFLYYALIGIFGVSAYQWFNNLESLRVKKAMNKKQIDQFWAKRQQLLKEINSIIPVA
jgi:hypothetical protein